MKKAMFYTIDAIIFTTILLSIILFIPSGKTSPETSDTTLFVSKDIMKILNEMNLSAVNQSWIASHNITDTNKTVLEQIGEFWVNNNATAANELAYQVLKDVDFEQIGISIWADDEELYTSATPPTTHYTTSWRTISGLEKSKPISGYVARAQARSVTQNGSKVISMSPEGAGWDSGYANITKFFNLTGLNVTSATLTMSIHADTANTDVKVIFNGGLCNYTRDQFTWLFPGDEGNIGSRAVTNCLKNTTNNMTVYLNNNAYNAHTHPGMYLTINYTRNISLEQKTNAYSERVYFDNIRSVEASSDDSGAWTSVPFYIPENAQNLSVFIKIVGNNVYNYGGSNTFSAWDGSSKRQRDYDYIAFLNSNTPFASSAAPATNAIYTYNYSTLASRLVNGTNVLSVYFNNYGDTAWGDVWTELYSRPFTNASGSSFIEINYTLQETQPYGLVEVSTIKQFTGSDGQDKTENFTFPLEATEKGDIYVHLAQQYSYAITTWANSYKPPTTQVFRSPSSRAIPTTTYIDESHFSLSPVITNYVRTKDDNSGNDIVVQASTIEYTFYVPSFVGYGDVFTTEEAATDDAIARLDTIAGPYLSLSDIQAETNAITKVPTLWGPAVIEVRAWD